MKKTRKTHKFKIYRIDHFLMSIVELIICVISCVVSICGFDDIGVMYTIIFLLISIFTGTLGVGNMMLAFMPHKYDEE